MSQSFYRHKVTKLIAKIDDEFAAQFTALEPVSDNVAEKGVSVEENTAALEVDNADSAPAEPKTVKKDDSSQEGSK